MCGIHGDRGLGARTAKFWWGKGGGGKEIAWMVGPALGGGLETGYLER